MPPSLRRASPFRRRPPSATTIIPEIAWRLNVGAGGVLTHPLALLLPHVERQNVGLLAVFVGPAVDRPLPAGVDVGQHRGRMRAAAVEQESARLRPLDLVVRSEE